MGGVRGWRVAVSAVVLSLPLTILGGSPAQSSDGFGPHPGPHPTAAVAAVIAEVSTRFPREMAGSRTTPSGEVLILIKGQASRELIQAIESTPSIHVSEGHLFSLADREVMSAKTANALLGIGVQDAGFAIDADSISISLTPDEDRGRVDNAVRQALATSDGEILTYEDRAASSGREIYENAAD